MQTETAVLRFGLGARPGELSAASGDPRGWLLAQVHGAVERVGHVDLEPSDRILAGFLAARRERREGVGGNVQPARDAYLPHYRAQVLARAQSAVLTRTPFAERLVHFWGNHFAISADKGVVLGLAGTLENEAVRPHVNGRFADMLLAAETHPAMVLFLDNQASTGPDSPVARRAAARAANRQPGINENLAREILELHTLGVNGGYAQADVTAFARVISGWSIDRDSGRFEFRAALHQPGDAAVLGRRYRDGGPSQGEAVLTDLARRPATAQFIAQKLVRHFVADNPPPRAVRHVAATFAASDGDLPQVYRALIEAADEELSLAPKFKTPEDLVISTWRAFDAAPSDAMEVTRAFESLGQRQFAPGSPAGWPDTAKSWDGSDGLMHRIAWSSRAAARLDSGVEPIALAAATLGLRARPATLQALGRASSPQQALTLLLMSPEFQFR